MRQARIWKNPTKVIPNIKVWIRQKRQMCFGMGEYYLDIETTGLDPYTDKIITIQYQELEQKTGKAKGQLHILKEWELGESGIIREFSNTPISSNYKFDFIPVGRNLKFEHKFLQKKNYRISIFDRPCIDLEPIMVLMNNGEFKNSGLDMMIEKNQSGGSIPEWYKMGQFEKIESYIRQETRSFVDFFSWLCSEMPALHKKFRHARGF